MRVPPRTLAVVAALLVGSGLAAADPSEPAVKLVEFGWDVPDPAYAAAHVRAMEERPFDGVILRLAGVDGKVFGGRRWRAADVEADLAALRRTEWRRFHDNFLLVHAASGVDWLRDADFRGVAANVRLLARTARLGGLKGLAFDPEPYGPNPWSYAEQVRGDLGRLRSFAEYEAAFRRRGAQFMRAIAREMPDARLLMLFQLGIFHQALGEPDPGRREALLAEDPYGLLPAFVNGMLDAARHGVVIVDGNEPSYYYASPLQYYRSYHDMRRRALRLVAPERARAYAETVEAGQAVYVDHVFGLCDACATARELSPEQRARWFEHDLYYALLTADEYVWLYSEKMSWWKDEGLPPGLLDAVRSARAKVAAGAPLGFEVAAEVEAARARTHPTAVAP